MRSWNPTRSAVFDQAENRLHAQKALLLMTAESSNVRELTAHNVHFMTMKNQRK